MTELATTEARPVEARLLHMVFPDHTNHLGTLFGGQALAWMDMSAFIAASRYARTTVVTARSEQVDFRLPIRQGQLVEVVARIVEVGRSSMQVEVELIAMGPDHRAPGEPPAPAEVAELRAPLLRYQPPLARGQMH